MSTEFTHIEQVFSLEEEKAALTLAQTAISYGLEFGVPMAINPHEQAMAMQQKKAVFVTLKIRGEIRGCMGSLEHHKRSMAENIASHSFAAAFDDPRFPPLSPAEYEKMTLEIQLLGDPELMIFSSEEGLIEQLKPEVDGLIFKAGDYTSTLLPTVWKDISDPKVFLQALKIKAGVAPDYWSRAVQIYRYETTVIQVSE